MNFIENKIIKLDKAPSKVLKRIKISKSYRVPKGYRAEITSSNGIKNATKFGFYKNGMTSPPF